MKILTLTLNPSLDVSGLVDNLVPNEKSYVTGVKQTPGGNGVNAGIIAHRLGGKVTLSGFVGGENGKTLKSLLTNEGVSHRFIPIRHNTRMNISIHAKDTHHQTRLSFPGPVITRDEWKKLEEKIGTLKAEKDIVVIGGSLPPGVSANTVSRLVRKLKEMNILTLVDVPCPALKTLVRAKPDFIKPNLTEFQELTGKKVKSIQEVLKEIDKLHRLVPLICVSSVEGGAILSDKTGAWFGILPKLKVRSTVGAGDSMVGAIAFLLAKNPSASIPELLRMGLAASAATLTEPGLTLGSAKAIHANMRGIKIRKLS